MSSEEDQTVMMKGKRTKRHRSLSPLASDDSAYSATSSGSDSTEEEEDMANCLMMLSQGDAARDNIQIKHHATNKAGFYVYECKTCNRSFPSFQALGGHRASHKKPKSTSSIDFNININITPTNIKQTKIHECSICGSEFTSGQALGGHMRRHRAPPQPHQQKTLLPLDLNLPAPEDDPLLRHSNFQFASSSSSQQPPHTLVFSAPALVDCHY